jgi:hypothetical protein
MNWKLYQIGIFLMSLDFNKSVTNPNLYHYSIGDESLILMTYSESVEYDALLLETRSMTECEIHRDGFKRRRLMMIQTRLIHNQLDH